MQLINNFKIGLPELQRGVGNVNPMKMARCIMELERIYGIRQGSNQYCLPNNSVGTQKQLADQIGIGVDTLQNYKKLNELIPELQSLVEILNWDFRKNKIKKRIVETSTLLNL